MREVALLRSIGLWRTVIVRMRADWAVVAAAWILLVCATTFLTAGMLYGDTVELGGIQVALNSAPATDRSIVVRSSALSGDLAALDGPIRSELSRVLERSGGTIAGIVGTDPFADAATDPAKVKTLLTLASFEDINQHATLAEGRWALPGAAIHEATLSAGAGAALGVHLGDQLDLVDRLDSSIVVHLTLVGIWLPDAADPYWLDAPQELHGATTSPLFTTVGPLVLPGDDLLDPAFGTRRTLEWRAVPNSAGFRPGDLAAIRSDATALASRIKSSLPSGAQVRVETRLPDLLASVSKSALVSRTGVLLLVLQFAVLAAYAIVLVAGMLADRRRAETALLRSRGASSGHLAAMTIFEATLLAGLAALVAPVLALAVVKWLSATGPLAESGIGATLQLSREALLVDVLAAIACIVALTVPMLGGFSSLSGVRAAISRQAGRTLAQRLGLDLGLVVLAGIALWQLRLYGAPLTRNARGALGIDPLLVAAPGIGLLAGAIVATRIIPRIAEISERLLQRDRGLVGAMGGRGLARRPLRYTRSALLLMLAAALGTFATAHVSTWTRSQGDQAAYQAGADLRIAPSGGSTADLAIGSAIRQTSGVLAVMPVERLSVDSGRGVRGAPLIALDAASAASIVIATPDADGMAHAALFTELSTHRPDPAGILVPDEARQLRVLVSAAFESVANDPSQEAIDLASYAGIRASFVLSDVDGRVYRLPADGLATLVGDGQPVALSLPAGMSRPVRLLAVEVGIGVPMTAVVAGAIEVNRFETTPSTASDAPAGVWATLDAHAGDPGWRWEEVPGIAQSRSIQGDADRPWRVTVADSGIGLLFGGAGASETLRLSRVVEPAPVDAIASRGFLAATGGAVGDTVQTSVSGRQQAIRIIGAAETFPTLDPGVPFLVVDGPSLAAQKFATLAGVSEDADWWVAASDPASVATTVLAKVDPGATIVDRRVIRARLLTDPVPLGVVGVLGLGSVAAMLFAAIGFVVAATVSTRERLGEFALLRALGLSARELSVWLWLENAFLLVVGIGVGLGLGALLAYVVLPVSILTTSGATAVPAPVVELPLGSVVPTVAVAVAVFIATTMVLRGQLLAVHIGDVLRGRDE